MAENKQTKQYITMTKGNGNILVSEDVIIKIVEHSAKEVEGVSGIATKPGADIADMIAKKNWGKGIKVHIAEDSSVTVDCNITVNYGHNIVTIAAAVQEAVSAALISAAGIDVTTVNVNVCGIARQ